MWTWMLSASYSVIIEYFVLTTKTKFNRLCIVWIHRMPPPKIPTKASFNSMTWFFFLFFLCRSLKNKWTRKIAIACTFIHLFRDYTEHWLLPIWIIMMITSRYYLILIFNVSSDLFEMITQRIWNRRICCKHITKEFFHTLFQREKRKRLSKY